MVFAAVSGSIRRRERNASLLRVKIVQRLLTHLGLNNFEPAYIWLARTTAQAA